MWAELALVKARLEALGRARTDPAFFAWNPLRFTLPLDLREPPPRLGGTPFTAHDKITFLHPGYAAPRNQLFSLPRLDQLGDRPDTRRGVHHRTALTACQIVANNAFARGRLCLDAEGREPAPEPLDGVLMASSYYFVIEGDERYPIVPSFQDWKFPHQDFPPGWPAPSDVVHGGQGPVTAATRHCVVTNSGLASTLAHLVPREHASWFALNAMSVYGTNARTINDESNLVRMRRDVHISFDERLFVIVPKPGRMGLRYVVHAVGEDDSECAALYHNTIVQNMGRVSREYLLARFAWCILIRLQPFLLACVPRRVVRLGRSGDAGPVSRIETLDGDRLAELYETPRSKRSRKTAEDVQEAVPAGNGDVGKAQIEDVLEDTEEAAVEEKKTGEKRAREKEAEDLRLAEERKAKRRKLVEEKEAEDKRKAAERKAEKKRRAEEKRAEEMRKAREKKAERQRKVKEKKAQEQKRAQERKAEKQRRAEEQRLAEEKKAEEKKAEESSVTKAERRVDEAIKGINHELAGNGDDDGHEGEDIVLSEKGDDVEIPDGKKKKKKKKAADEKDNETKQK